MQQSTHKPHSGAGLIALERAEQIVKHGRTFETDSKYYSRDVFQNAAIAILHHNKKEWPDSHIPMEVYDKIMQKDKQGQVAVAGAFLAAEIDYLNYKALWGKWLGEKDVPAEVGEPVCEQIDNMTDETVNLASAADGSGVVFTHTKFTFEFPPAAMFGIPPHIEALKKSPAAFADYVSSLNADKRKIFTDHEPVPFFTMAAGTGKTQNMVNAIKEMERMRDPLGAWTAHQKDLSKNVLVKATNFLRDKGLLTEDNSIFVIKYPRNGGTEHINLAQLLQDFRVLCEQSKIQFDLKVKDNFSAPMNKLNEACSNALVAMMKRDVFVAYLNAVAEAFKDNTAYKQTERWKTIKANMEAVYKNICTYTPPIKGVGFTDDDKVLFRVLRAMISDTYDKYVPEAIEGYLSRGRDITTKGIVAAIRTALSTANSTLSEKEVEVEWLYAKGGTTTTAATNTPTDTTISPNLAEWKKQQTELATGEYALATEWLRKFGVLTNPANTTVLIPAKTRLGYLNLAGMLHNFAVESFGIGQYKTDLLFGQKLQGLWDDYVSKNPGKSLSFGKYLLQNGHIVIKDEQAYIKSCVLI